MCNESLSVGNGKQLPSRNFYFVFTIPFMITFNNQFAISFIF